MRKISPPSFLLVAPIMALLGLFLLSSPFPAQARPVRVNLGTLAPRGSSYYRSLQTMAQAWKDAPGDGVRLVIYPDGTQGGEADMIRLMRVGTLQAGLLTAVGLADIEKSVSGLQGLPMMFQTLEESAYVNEKLRPKLEQRLLAKGFVVLFWVDAGWIRYFSKEPVLHPTDLASMKIFVWAGHPAQIEITRAAGYKPVPLETEQIIPGLTTGLINVVTVPPIYALAGQLDRAAPHMLELNWAPLVGAAVITRDAWEKIPAAARPALLQTAAKAGKEIEANSRKESDEAVAAMKTRGLTVHTVTPDIEAEWRKTVEAIYPQIRGGIVPADVFDEVQRLVKEYRSGRGGNPR